MVSLVTMSTTEAAIAVRRWELQRRVTLWERVNSRAKTLSGPNPPAFMSMVGGSLGPRCQAVDKKHETAARARFAVRKTMVDVSLCYVCDRWYVTKLCDRWYVTKLCVKFVYVKDGM